MNQGDTILASLRIFFQEPKLLYVFYIIKYTLSCRITPLADETLHVTGYKMLLF